MIVVDTSALIGAFNAHYLPDSIGGFWSFLDAQREAGLVVVPWAVYDELRHRSDGAYEWTRTRKGLVSDPSEEVQRLAGDLMQRFRFKPGRDRADPFVLAEARSRGFGIATYEGMSPTGTVAQSKQRYDSIPDICARLGVDCFQPARAWRELGLML